MAKKNQNKETVSTASNEVVDTTTNQENITPDIAPGDENSQEISEETQEIETTNPKESQKTPSETLNSNPSGFFEDENGGKWGFTKRTPEKFRFNGVIKNKAEWLQDEDAMEMLIYGNSMYINQLN
jgi:hypothetical protein